MNLTHPSTATYSRFLHTSANIWRPVYIVRSSLRHIRNTASPEPQNFHNLSYPNICSLTHCGRVTQVCVYALQLWKTNDAHLRFWHALGFHALYTLITQYMQPFSEWSCWRVFIETWPHSEVMIFDKYREQTARYVPLLLCTAFSQLSDFNHFTPMTERGSSYEENYLTEDEISAELLANTLSGVPEDADSDSENVNDSSIIGNRQTKVCILYRALLGCLVSISWKFQFTKIDSEFVINF